MHFELSRPVQLRHVSERGRSFSIDADAAERAALVERLRLVELRSLTARGALEWQADGDGLAGGGVRAGRDGMTGADVLKVAGTIDAVLVQTCSVTLEPFEINAELAFERRFLPGQANDVGEVLVDPDTDAPEPLVGDVIDLGELVVEELCVELDPYPRSAEADDTLASVEDATPSGPFAALGQLAGKLH